MNDNALVALHPQIGLGVNPDRLRAQWQEIPLVPLVVSELIKAASCFPLVFSRSMHTGALELSAVLGLEQGRSLFFGDSASDPLYLPAQLRRGPLSVADGDSADSFQLLINRQHAAVTSASADALYVAGVESAWLVDAKEALAELLQGQGETEAFVAALSQLALLVPLQLRWRDAAGETLEVNGLYVIDEHRLADMDQQALLHLHNQDWLKLVYAMVVSQTHLYGLLQRRQQQKMAKSA